MTELHCFLDHPVCFQYLGPRPVARWFLRHLPGLRGLDRVVCWAPEEDLAEAGVLLDGAEGVALRRLDVAAGTDLAALERLVVAPHHEGGEGALVLLRPVHPFLPPQKIEVDLDSLGTHPERHVFSREVRGVQPGPRRLETTVLVPLQGVLIQSTRRTETIGTTRDLPATEVEALDLTRPFDLKVAYALVEGGP
jgi:hypothetical protein